MALSTINHKISTFFIQSIRSSREFTFGDSQTSLSLSLNFFRRSIFSVYVCVSIMKKKSKSWNILRCGFIFLSRLIYFVVTRILSFFKYRKYSCFIISMILVISEVFVNLFLLSFILLVLTPVPDFLMCFGIFTIR